MATHPVNYMASVISCKFIAIIFIFILFVKAPKTATGERRSMLGAILITVKDIVYIL